ncbi:hypothetical protein PP175_28955 (plasmid) [Aneurinibacillus sp. Ricciae_BoGa-3]|uniref:hypothetical protein n=1 Tax=Aneurinibacillus sp. Ricciae_BoGa-3 TaxID=3022697 RepID=UPI00233FC294|nr:hypothetical protein [Aneurinibacillus sp. Ricciae_BoGa-3]WCK57221.1 hypothetical protein PP175_28955 [Aneurinibacillus sp. Ricciae_BoGa-3]
MKLFGREVYDALNSEAFGKDVREHFKLAKEQGYQHLAFNDRIYDVSDESLQYPLCMVNQLKEN